MFVPTDPQSWGGAIGGPLHATLLAATGVPTGTGANTAEATLFRYAIPAKMFAAVGSTLRATFTGSCANNANNKAVTVRVGPNGAPAGGATSSFDALPVGNFRLAWKIVFHLTLQASGSFEMSILSMQNVAAGVVVYDTQAISQDETLALTIRLIGQNSTAAANDVVMTTATMEWLPAQG